MTRSHGVTLLERSLNKKQGYSPPQSTICFFDGINTQIARYRVFTQTFPISFSNSYNTNATYLAIKVTASAIFKMHQGIAFRRYGSTANAWQGGTNVNIVAMNCIVGFLVNLAIALHYYGMGKTQGSGRSLARSNAIWTERSRQELQLSCLGGIQLEEPRR
ncbi:hypothetical protein JOM56_015446 [Amanita muscaria]